MEIPLQAIIKNNTPPPYEVIYNNDIETAQLNINNNIELLINTFKSFGINDTDEIINNIQNNPNDYINDDKPIIKNFALATIDYNNIINNYDNERITTSLTTLKNYIDKKIKKIYDDISSIQNNYNIIITQQNNKIQNRLNIIEYVEIITTIMFNCKYSQESVLFKQILIGNINYVIHLFEKPNNIHGYNLFHKNYELLKLQYNTKGISLNHIKLSLNNWIHTFIDSPEYNDFIKMFEKYKRDYGKEIDHLQRTTLFIHKLYIWLNTDNAKTFIDNGDIIIDDNFDYISKYKDFEI